LQIKDAIPDLLSRAVPTVESGTLIMVAGTLLDIPRSEVLLITSTAQDGFEYLMKDGRWMAFSGYPVLKKMIATRPADLYKFLYGACESVALHLDPLSSESGLQHVLETFLRTEFGFTLIKAPDSLGLVTLTDLLSLYGEALDTDLHVGDVASQPVLSLPKETGLQDAVREMFKRRVRRVRISATNAFVSDREILAFIFSPKRLNAAREYPEKMLDTTLEDVGPVEAIEVDAGVGVKEAAAIIKPGSGTCLTVGNGGPLVTPWDLVIKPFKARHLLIGRRT
jgi:CBS domain-containing protein